MKRSPDTWLVGLSYGESEKDLQKYLRFTIYDLRFTIYDLQFTIYDLRLLRGNLI